MTDPNMPNDPRFTAPQQPTPPQPPQAPVPPQPPVQPPQAPAQPPQAPQWAAQPPQAPAQPQQWAAPAAATPPPGAPTDQAFVHGATVQDTVEKKPSVVARVGLVAAALAVAGGGAFAVTRALSEPAGPETPDEAVAQLFEAIDNDDLIGLTEVMLPSEREALIEPMADLFTELERLEIIDESIDIEAESDGIALDFSVTGLEFTTTEVGTGVVNVQVDAGVVTVQGEVGDLPFGAQVTDELEPEDLAEPIDEEIVDFAEEEDVRFTIVEEDGSWYISLWYTVAELAREEAGEPAPDFGNGITPVGGETPEDALRIMFEAASDLDPERAMAALDPNEFRALHDYAPLFMDDLDEAVAEARSAIAEEGITWSIDRLDLSSSEVRGRTFVSVDGIAISAASEAEGESVSFDYDGDCFTVVVDSEIDQACTDELRSELDGELPSAYFDLIEEQRAGVTVVERDGQWYVSGVPTLIGAYTDLFASLEREDIDEFVEFFEDLTSGFVGLSDPFLGGGNTDPFLLEEDPFFEEEPYDPFAEEDPFDDEETFDFAAFEVSAEDAALFPDDWVLNGGTPDFAYFANSMGLTATSYADGFAPSGGPTIYLERIDATAEEMSALMAGVSPYVQVEVEGYPEGATVWDWEGVDRAVVIDGFVVSAFFDEDGTAMQVLLERVNAIASR